MMFKVKEVFIMISIKKILFKILNHLGGGERHELLYTNTSTSGAKVLNLTMGNLQTTASSLLEFDSLEFLMCWNNDGADTTYHSFRLPLDELENLSSDSTGSVNSLLHIYGNLAASNLPACWIKMINVGTNQLTVGRTYVRNSSTATTNTTSMASYIYTPKIYGIKTTW